MCFCLYRHSTRQNATRGGKLLPPRVAYPLILCSYLSSQSEICSTSIRISVSGPWYVVPGYSYRLQVTATTYDSDGNFIEAPVEYSPISDY